MHLPQLLADISLWDMFIRAKPFPMAIQISLLLVSVASWTLIFAKWKHFRAAEANNRSFLKTFRQAPGLGATAQVVRQFPLSPLVTLFEYGYEEFDRQIRTRGSIVNKTSVERALQIGLSTEMSKLDERSNWLATVATVAPFIGLFGTVWGIIDAFAALGTAGSASLAAVAPGISEALFATALGLGAAIPAAVAYNYFSHRMRDIATRMEDFSLEFMNQAERTLEG